MEHCLGIGFSGPGWIGAVQLRKLAARSDVHLVAVHGPNEASASHLLEELSLPRSLYQREFAVMLGQPGVDLVWIASPNAAHGGQLIQALEAGKHVFCEKPVSIEYREYVRIRELCRRMPHLKTFVDYVLYFNPMEARLREMVAAKMFGSLVQVQVNYRHPINISGRRAWKLSKGAMGDAISMGINHALSVMCWIFEADGQTPQSVFATSAPARERAFEVEPIWNILVEFSGGGTGFCFGNIDFNRGYDAYHNVTGTDGAFVFDAAQRPAQKVRYWSKQCAGSDWLWPLDAATTTDAETARYAWPASTTLPDSGDVLDHGLDEAIDCFLDSVRSGQDSPLSVERTNNIVDIGWAAQISAKRGSKIFLPLRDEDAAQLLS